MEGKTRCQRDSIKLALVWEWKTAYVKPHHLLGQGPERGQPIAWAVFHPKNDPCYGLTPFRLEHLRPEWL